jgi:hypothetical protein
VTVPSVSLREVKVMSEENEEMEGPYDNCDSCGNDYEFHNDKDSLVIWLTTPNCNHVEAICPHCSNEVRIYCEPEVILWILKECRLGIKLGLAAPKDMQERMAEDDTEPTFTLTESFPEELPGWVWRQLGDDIRKFEHGEE